MFAHYFEERIGGKVIEAPCVGFVAYRILPENKEAFIHEIYIAPEHRKEGAGGHLMNQVAEEALAAGCRFLTASISHAAKTATTALRSALAYGFRVHSSNINEIFLIKEI